MSTQYLAGRRVVSMAKKQSRRLLPWAYKLARRVEQFKEPGEYQLRLIVRPEGKRILIVNETQVDDLGF